MNCGRVRSGSSSGSPVKTVYTYVQLDAKKYSHVRTYGRGLERLLAHTYGQGSCTWNGSDGVLFIGSQPAGSERRNCVVVFIGRQQNACCSSGANRLGRNGRSKRGLAYRRTKETALFSTAYGRNRILFTKRGVAYRRKEETTFCSTGHGRNGILLIGR